jgi:excisionase family DNA binding protein
MLKSVLETSKILGVSEVTLRRLIKLRRISYRKIGDRYLFSQSDIDNYVESVKVQAVPKKREAANA